MGDNSLTNVFGPIIRKTDSTQYKTALQIDLLPRNSSGVVTKDAGSLGDAARPWKNAFITTGYWTIGDIKLHHSFNGAAPIGQGWMLMDGRVVNLANYDAEHSPGDWVKFIGSSGLNGLNLPPMTNKYPVGVAATTQDGSAPITPVGNTSHQINLQHSHTTNAHIHTVVNHVHSGSNHSHAVAAHNHQWLIVNPSNANDQTFDVNGTTKNLTQSGNKDSAALLGMQADDESFLDFPAYTSNRSLITDLSGTNDTGGATPDTGTQSDSGTDNQLSVTQSIQPESIEVQYYMRII